MKFFLLINVKMSTIVGILTFMSRKNSILGLSEPENAEFLDIDKLFSFSACMIYCFEHVFVCVYHRLQRVFVMVQSCKKWTSA